MTVLTLDVIARDRASKILAGIGKKTDETSGKFTKWGAAAAGAGVIVGASLIKFAKDSVTAYSEAQEGQKRLQDAFQRFPALADTNQKALQKLNTALQKKTKYDDDNIASGQAVLAQFKLTGSQLTTITPLLLDYASRTGKDIPAAAQDVGKALLGNAKALKNIGIKYTATGDTAKDFTNITALLRTQVGGFANREGTTAAGQAAILKNQFGEVEETVGSQLVPALMKLTSGLLVVIAFTQKYARVIVPIVAVLGTLVAVIYTLVTVQKIWNAALIAWDVIVSANPIGLIIIGIVALVAAIVLAYKHSETFRNIVNGAFRSVAAVVGTVVTFIRAHWQLLFAILTGPVGLAVLWIVRHWDGVTALFRGAAKVFGKLLSGVTNAITAPFRAAFAIIMAGFHAAEAVANKVNDMLHSGKGPVTSRAPITTPHRASGGPVTRGTAYLVGEEGPELFVPGQSGGIVPNGGGRGSSASAGSDDFTASAPLVLQIDSTKVWQGLVVMKRRKGNVSLGLG